MIQQYLIAKCLRGLKVVVSIDVVLLRQRWRGASKHRFDEDVVAQTVVDEDFITLSRLDLCDDVVVSVVLVDGVCVRLAVVNKFQGMKTNVALFGDAFFDPAASGTMGRPVVALDFPLGLLPESG